MDDEADNSPALPSIPQYEALIFPRSHTLLSNIIKSQTNNLRSMGPSGIRRIMIYSIMEYFSWFESALFHQLALSSLWVAY